jgi:hypothetical protein
MKTEKEVIEKGCYINDRWQCELTHDDDNYYQGWLDCLEWVIGIREEFDTPPRVITLEPVLTEKGLKKLGIDKLKITDIILDYKDENGNLLY